MKTKMIIAGVLAALLAGVGIAWAAVGPTPQDQMLWFRNGILVMPNSLKAQATATSAAKVTRMLAGSETFDFANTTIVCEDSTGHTVTGAQVNDGCEVGPTNAPGNGTFSCYVSAADTVKVHFCPAGTAVNPASQPFRTYIRSNQ